MVKLADFKGKIGSVAYVLAGIAALGIGSYLVYDFSKMSKSKKPELKPIVCTDRPISEEKVVVRDGIEGLILTYCNPKDGRIDRFREVTGDKRSSLYISYSEEFANDISSVKGNVNGARKVDLKFEYPLIGKGFHVSGNDGCRDIKGNFPIYADTKKVVNNMKRLFFLCDSLERNIFK